MTEFGKFSRLILGVVAALSIAATLASMFFGEKFTTAESFQNDTYSYSAIGHRFFYEWLEFELESPVNRITTDEYYVDDVDLVWVIEPKSALTEFEYFANQRVLVLPKRTGSPDEDRKFIERHTLVELYRPNELVKQHLDIYEANTVVRVDTLGDVVTNPYNLPVPSFTEGPVQLLTGLPDEVIPVFETSNGVLIAMSETSAQLTFIVSDPDIFSNFVMTDEQRSKFAGEFVKRVVDPEKEYLHLIDETVHGYKQKPSILKLMSTFPYSLVTIHFILLSLLLCWRGFSQFGRTYSSQEKVDYGPRTLVENTANLFEVEHSAHLGSRYVSAIVRSVAASLNAPDHLGRNALLDWLEELGERREVTVSIVEQVREMNRIEMDLRSWTQRDVVQIIESVNRWKSEILNER